MVLELLIYAKSAIKNFDQSEASFESHMTTYTYIHQMISTIFIHNIAFILHCKEIRK